MKTDMKTDTGQDRIPEEAISGTGHNRAVSHSTVLYCTLPLYCALPDLSVAQDCRPA